MTYDGSVHRWIKGEAMAESGDTEQSLFIGKGEQPAWLTLNLANRHGLVTGATGTGKTVSLQVMGRSISLLTARRSSHSLMSLPVQGNRLSSSFSRSS